MKYLVELSWTDAVASAVTKILSTLPPDVEQSTGYLPPGINHGFVVISADDRGDLDRLTRAVAGVGADVRVIAAHERKETGGRSDP